MFRRTAIDEVGGYYGGFSAHGIEDWDFWLRLLAAGYRAAMVSEPLYEYRVRVGSMSQAMYGPSEWRRLMQEFVIRHRRLFDAHLAEVVGALSVQIAEIREWAVARERAMYWWQGNASSWQRTAMQQSKAIEDLHAWIGELQRAKEWNDEQRQRWEARARELESRMASSPRDIE
jgi:hypothetical protein